MVADTYARLKDGVNMFRARIASFSVHHFYFMRNNRLIKDEGAAITFAPVQQRIRTAQGIIKHTRAGGSGSGALGMIILRSRLTLRGGEISIESGSAEGLRGEIHQVGNIRYKPGG